MYGFGCVNVQRQEVQHVAVNVLFDWNTLQKYCITHVLFQRGTTMTQPIFTPYLELTAVIPCSMMWPYLLLTEGQITGDKSVKQAMWWPWQSLLHIPPILSTPASFLLSKHHCFMKLWWANAIFCGTALEDLDSKREPSNSPAPHTCLNRDANLYITQKNLGHMKSAVLWW